MPYLIDGHNLIPKLGLRLDSPDDEMELVAVLQEYVRLNRRELEVYFDGAPPGHAETRRLGPVKAHFIRLGQTADSAIRARLQKLGRAARNWIIVSSDREIQAAAYASGAGSLTSDEFASVLRQTRQTKPKQGEDRVLPASEVEEWLGLFNRGNRRRGE